MALVPLLQAHAEEGALLQAFDWGNAQLLAAIAVVGLPLLASLVIFLAGKRMWRGGGLLAVAAVAGSLVASLYLFWTHIVQGHDEVLDFSRNWFTVGEFHFTFGFLLDNLSIWLAT